MRKLKLKVVHETKTGAMIQVGKSRTFLSKFSPLYEALRAVIEDGDEEELGDGAKDG